MPQHNISEMKRDCEHELKVHVSLHRCKRAKRKIMQDMNGFGFNCFTCRLVGKKVAGRGLGLMAPL